MPENAKFCVVPPVLIHIIYRTQIEKAMQDEVIYRYLTGKCTPEEELQMMEWYQEDPETRQRDIDRVRLIFEGMLVHQVIGTVEKRSKRIWTLRKVARYSAGLAAGLLLFAGGLYWMRSHTYDEISAQLTSFETPAGQRVSMDLSDGTHVWLNAGSRIEYPVVFDRRVRRVRISGEAMFDVTHDADRPFIVETFASRIEVLGTKFNVVADESRSLFSTTLLEGKVKVSSGDQNVILHPDEVVNLINGHLLVFHNNDPVAMQWPEGILSMKGISFEELMAKFERIYDVKIVYECEKIPTIEFASGKIRISDGIDHALRVLQHVSDFTYERDEEHNIIRIK